jgi:nickel-type superoxide dismutase maturation protease
MVPALRDGDYLLVLRTRRVRPGQIVLAEDPERPGLQVVKRIARWESGGWWLASDFAHEDMRDSRRYGPVPPAKVIGLVVARYHPNLRIFGGFRGVVPPG